jgi:hypothetical protein
MNGTGPAIVTILPGSSASIGRIFEQHRAIICETRAAHIPTRADLRRERRILAGGMIR